LGGFTLGKWVGEPPGPRPYAPIVERWASAYNVDPLLASAMLEAESSGRPEAVSSSGALGLMQLMLPTAEEVAKELGLGSPSRDDVLDPDLNVRLGVYYLSKLRQRFDDERELVIAAYHAGPTRVDKWRCSRADLSSAEVIEELAYPDTRKYVRRVLYLWKRNAARDPSRSAK
jgi:soluble lytic murein transglycosylase